MARARAAGRLTCGAYFVGALNRPAIIAASGEREVAHRFAEIELRGGLHAEGAAAEIGAIEIKPQDLSLGQPEFEPDGEIGLLDLALQRALVGEEDIFGELLRDASSRPAPRSSARALTVSARNVPITSTPKWSKNRRSSVASTASIRFSGSSSKDTKSIMLDAAPADLLAVAVEKRDREILLLQPVVRGLLKRRNREGERDEAAADAERQRLAGEFGEDAATAGDVKPVHEGGKRGVALASPSAPPA